MRYPCLFLYLIEKLNRPKELEICKQEYLEFKNSKEFFSLYVHGYWIPWLA